MTDEKEELSGRLKNVSGAKVLLSLRSPSMWRPRALGSSSLRVLTAAPALSESAPAEVGVGGGHREGTPAVQASSALGCGTTQGKGWGSQLAPPGGANAFWLGGVMTFSRLRHASTRPLPAAQPTRLCSASRIAVRVTPGAQRGTTW